VVLSPRSVSVLLKMQFTSIIINAARGEHEATKH